MNKISKMSQTKILDSLDKVSELVNVGEDPNEVIAKIASQMKIPAGHIHLIVSAYNTGKSNVQRKSTDDVWDKSAEFTLANTAKILDLMFPDNVKSASHELTDTIVSYEYKTSPTWVGELKAADKRASYKLLETKLTDKKLVPYPREDHSYKNANIEIKRLERSLEDARYKTAYAFDVAITCKDKLHELLKRSAHTHDYHNVKVNSTLLFGKPAEQLFTQLETENVTLAKQACSDTLTPAIGPVYEAVSDCISAYTFYQELNDNLITKQASTVKQISSLKAPFTPAAKLDPVLGVPVPMAKKAGSQSKNAADDNNNDKR